MIDDVLRLVLASGHLDVLNVAAVDFPTVADVAGVDDRLDALIFEARVGLVDEIEAFGVRAQMRVGHEAELALVREPAHVERRRVRR